MNYRTVKLKPILVHVHQTACVMAYQCLEEVAVLICHE